MPQHSSALLSRCSGLFADACSCRKLKAGWRGCRGWVEKGEEFLKTPRADGALSSPLKDMCAAQHSEGPRVRRSTIPGLPGYEASWKVGPASIRHSPHGPCVHRCPTVPRLSTLTLVVANGMPVFRGKLPVRAQCKIDNVFNRLVPLPFRARGVTESQKGERSLSDRIEVYPFG